MNYRDFYAGYGVKVGLSCAFRVPLRMISPGIIGAIYKIGSLRESASFAAPFNEVIDVSLEKQVRISSIEALPTEVMQIALSYLGTRDIEAFAVASRLSSESSIRTKCNQKQEQLEFIMSIIASMEQHEFSSKQNVLNKLKQISSSIEIDYNNSLQSETTFKEIQDINSRLYSVKESLVDIFIGLSDLNIKSIEDKFRNNGNQKQVAFYRNILEIAKICKNFSEIPRGPRGQALFSEMSQEEMEKLIPSIRNLVEIGAFERAINLAENSIPSGLRNGAFVSIAFGLARKDAFTKALDLMLHFSKQHDCDRLLEFIVSRLAKKREFEKALELAERISEDCRDGAHRSIAVAFAENGDVEKALELAERISEDCRDGAHRSMAVAFAENGDVEKALELAERISEDYRDGPHGAIAVAFAENGDVERALELIEKISTENIRNDANKAVVEELIERFEFERAIEITKRITCSYTYSNFLRWIVFDLVKSWDFNRAIEVAKISPDSFEVIISSLIEKGDIDLAYTLVKKEYPKGFELIMTELFTKNELDQALRLLTEFEKEARVKKCLVVSQISKTFAENGDFDKALELAMCEPFKGCMSEYNRQDLLAKIAEELADKGEIDRALSVVKMITGLEKGPPSIESFRSGTLKRISKAFMIKGEFEKGHKIIDEIRDVYFGKIEVLGDVAQELAKKGQFDEALKLANDMSNKDSTLASIAEQLVLYDQVKRAFELANHSADEKSRSIVLASMVRALAMKGENETALEIAKSIPDHDECSDAFSYIAQKLVNMGQNKKALGLVENFRDESSRSDIMGTIIETLVEKGNVEEAYEIAKNLSENMIRSWSFRFLADALEKENKLKKALDIARKVPENKYMSNPVQPIALAFAERESNYEVAIEAAKSISNEKCSKNTIRHIELIRRRVKTNESTII